MATNEGSISTEKEGTNNPVKEEVAVVPPTQPMTAEELQDLFKDAIKTDEKGNFKKLVINQELFKKLEESIVATIKSMEKNPSMFTRAAEYWGQIPLWQKIAGGVALTIPTLIIGIIANIGFLLALCGVTTVIYTAGGIILDDHHKCSTSVVNSLTTGVLELAHILELLITALNGIVEGLTKEVEEFKLENARLTVNVNELGVKIETLSKEIATITATSEALKATKDDLEQTATNLKGKIGEQSDLLDNAQNKLAQAVEDYEANQKELAEKVAELTKVKDDIAEQASKISTLKEVADALTAGLVANRQAQESFKQKLEEFLANKESTFGDIAVSLGKTASELEATKEELKRFEVKYKEDCLSITTESSRQLKVLEGITLQQTKLIQEQKEIIQELSKLIPQNQISPLLKKYGHFAKDAKLLEASIGALPQLTS